MQFLLNSIRRAPPYLQFDYSRGRAIPLSQDCFSFVERRNARVLADYRAAEFINSEKIGISEK